MSASKFRLFRVWRFSSSARAGDTNFLYAMEPLQFRPADAQKKEMSTSGDPIGSKTTNDAARARSVIDRADAEQNERSTVRDQCSSPMDAVEEEVGTLEGLIARNRKKHEMARTVEYKTGNKEDDPNGNEKEWVILKSPALTGLGSQGEVAG